MRIRGGLFALGVCALASVVFAPGMVRSVGIDGARAVARALDDPLSLLQQRSPGNRDDGTTIDTKQGGGSGGQAGDLAPSQGFAPGGGPVMPGEIPQMADAGGGAGVPPGGSGFPSFGPAIQSGGGGGSGTGVIPIPGAPGASLPGLPGAGGGGGGTSPGTTSQATPPPAGPNEPSAPGNPVVPTPPDQPGTSNPPIPRAPESTSTTVTTTAPEPGTWMMLILGFSATGAAMRSRRRDTAKVCD
jgi:hypothetical protein